MGMCSAQLRDDVGVRAHFAQAVTLDVDVDVPGFAPPKVVELLEQARTEQRKRLIEQLAARSGTAEGAAGAGTTEGAETAEAAKTATDQNLDDKNASSPNSGSERAANDDGAPAQIEQASEGAAAPNSTDQTTSAPTVADTNLLPWTAAAALGLGAVALGVVAVGLTGAGVYFATLYASPDAYQGEAFRNGLIAQALWIAAAGAGLTMLGAAVGAGGSVVWALAE